MARMNTLYRHVLLAGSVLLLSALAARASAGTDLITLLDSDKDGKISLKEAVRDADLLQRFGHIDENGDGLLTRDELDADDRATGSDVQQTG
ncbi:calcium-binding protein [Alteromonas sp. CYL-A6]|uniref:calcium-binding protein n=1 Tax=Alteromonas nitratireducens TaxID=3390813 RepID=UPI0034B6C57B